MADVEFDNISISQGARLHLNGDQTVTAISGGKVVANQTNGDEVESAEASALLPSFINDHYGADQLSTYFSNASLITADIFKANQKYLPGTDNSFWLADESSTYGVPIQAWRTATNGTESLTKAAQGKAPNGTLFTPAPEYASTALYDYMLNYPKKTIPMNGYDVKSATQFKDCSWPATTKTWSLDSKEKQTCWQHSTTLSRTIYNGKEVYNNPWCIEDHSKGYYKTTATTEYFNKNLIEGRVEIFEGSDTADPAAFFHTRATMYSPIEAGDVLFLSVQGYYLRDTTGFSRDDVTNGSKYPLYNIYFKSEEDGQIQGFNIYYAPVALGVHDATQETDAVKGQLLDAGKHALRPAIDLDTSKIAFFRDSTSNSDLAVSTQLGSTPRASAGNGNNLKTVLSSDEQKISFDVKASNCSTDRDEGRNKITTVKNSTVYVPWKSTELTLNNVSVSNASYISALVQKDTNKKYAVLAKAEDGQVKIDLTNLMQWVGDKVSISLYAEEPSDAGWSDFISAEPITFDVEMAAASPQKIVYDINGGQGTTPAETVANAGEEVNLADGSKLVSATGNAFSRWEVTYTLYGETEAVTTMMHSQELMVMPDVTGDGTTGVITAKAIYAGGMKAAKSTDYVSSQTITFDSNAPTGTTATVDGTKTTVEVQAAFGQPLGSSTIPADSGLTCTAIDGSIWVFGGWSQTKTDTIENSMTNAELTAEQVVVNAPMTFYAIWMKTNGFWLGTKAADETFFNEAQFKKNDDNYDTSTNILADMQVLHNSGNAKYSTTKTKWDGYCTGDNIRLYSTYSGGTGLNSMVEFRVIEVSGATGHDGDESAVTFMASTVLPEQYAPFSTLGENKGGWAVTPLRSSMNSGEIYNYFPTNLTNNIKSVTKKYCEGYIKAGGFDISNRTKYATCKDKLWLISYVEAKGQPTQDPNSSAPPSAEGVQYSWAKNNAWENAITMRSGEAIQRRLQTYTRSPGYYYFSFLSTTYWDPYYWWYLTDDELQYTKLYINPCFCF